MVRSAAGEATNILVEKYPDTCFVIEDLDLKGTKGQKRFAYKALHHSLESKAPTLVVNPAYTSQMCPSCGYISRNNRSGIKFHCRSCGRKGHADVVGGINLLGRSEDKQISLDDDKSEVKTILRERYISRRNKQDVDSSSGEFSIALAPSSQRFTTKVPGQPGFSTASNQVPSFC